MRITQTQQELQFLAAVNTLQTNLSQTQNQLSSGLAFQQPSDNPVAAGAVTNLNQVLAANQQYQSNATGVQSSLSTEDNALSQLQNQLQSLRSLALQANSGGTAQNRTALATQVQQIQGTLLSLANTQDGNGNYIFAGYATQTQPFALSATGATYSGDQGQPQSQIAAGQTIASGDSGDVVFNQIKSGNGTFTVTPAAANTGTGVVGATTVTNAATYGNGTYAITFGAANSYQVTNAANAVVATGTYTDGQAISFSGAQVTLSGAPANGDVFSVAPSGNQGLFTSVQNLLTALQSPVITASDQAKFGNAINAALNNIDQALNQTAVVRASVGGRLNTITTQQSIASAQQIQLQQSVAALQGTDYASAITTLDSQNTALSAALQAYTVTQGLSLFKFM